MKAYRIVVLFTLLLSAGACGTKGDLVLPDPAPASTPPPADMASAADH